MGQIIVDDRGRAITSNNRFPVDVGADSNPLAVQLSGSNPGRAVAITPDDNADLAITPTEYISVGVAGDVQLDTEYGDTITVWLAAGMLHKIRATRIYSTSTTATGITAWYDPAVTYSPGYSDIVRTNVIAEFDLRRPAGTQLIVSRNGDMFITNGSDTGANATDGTFDGQRVVFDPANGENLNLWSGALAAAFNGAEGYVHIVGRVRDSGVWSDAVTRYLLNLQVNGNNSVKFFKTGTPNANLARYIAGGITKDITVTLSTTDDFLVTLAWSKANDVFRAYVNGAQVSTDQTGLGTYSGTLAGTTSQALGASATSGVSPWDGSARYLIIGDAYPSAADVLQDYNALHSMGLV